VGSFLIGAHHLCCHLCSLALDRALPSFPLPYAHPTAPTADVVAAAAVSPATVAASHTCTLPAINAAVAVVAALWLCLPMPPLLHTCALPLAGPLVHVCWPVLASLLFVGTLSVKSIIIILTMICAYPLYD
jgi:hypothetical protein